jgi:hypothetical protein
MDAVGISSEGRHCKVGSCEEGDYKVGGGGLDDAQTNKRGCERVAIGNEME